MAYDVLRQGQNAGAVFNTANEVAVEHFLARKISFPAVFSVVAHMLDTCGLPPPARPGRGAGDHFPHARRNDLLH